MSGEVEFAFLAITSIVAIMNPASTLAVYTALTENESKDRSLKIVTKSMKISLVVLIFFALTGQFVFSIFNITIASFKIAGGILMIILSLGMLTPKRTEYKPEDYEDYAIVPLAFPLTAGPGTITTVILLASEVPNPSFGVFVISGIVVGIAISYYGMKYSSRVTKLLPDGGLRVITKLIAIIVLALAVQFIINGIIDTIPLIFSE